MECPNQLLNVTSSSCDTLEIQDGYGSFIQDCVHFFDTSDQCDDTWPWSNWSPFFEPIVEAFFREQTLDCFQLLTRRWFERGA